MIKKNLPIDTYALDDGDDLGDLVASIQSAVDDAESQTTDFLDDLGVNTADGEGLDWTGENYLIPRPPGMADEKFAAVIAVVAGGRRGTVAIIKALLEAATGLTWTVKDRQLDLDESLGLNIPLFEIWAKASGSTGQPYGLAYASYTTHVDGSPEESGVAGPILNDVGLAGGRYNDHAWGAIDGWTQTLLDRVRPNSTRVVFKDF
jgi:hypothetical protein